MANRELPLQRPASISAVTPERHSCASLAAAAADAVANRMTELMGEQRPAADVVPLRARQ